MQAELGLTNKTDEDLINEYQTSGDKAIRDKILNKYLYIAEIVTKRYVGKGAEYDDLFQVCCVGLLLAIERFDITKGFLFKSFATPTVLGDVKRYFRDKVFAIKIPRKYYNIYKQARLLSAKDENLTPEETSVRLNVPLSSVLEVLRWENESKAGLNVESSGYEEEDRAFINIENKAFVKECLEKLNSRESEFIKLRYYKKLTQKEIANEMNLTQMTISRLEKKVLAKMKKMYFS